jgi:hypothetical protein
MDAGFDYTCTLKEVVEAITSKGFDKKLNITNDCCYSGGWCHEAKILLDSSNKTLLVNPDGDERVKEKNARI